MRLKSPHSARRGQSAVRQRPGQSSQPAPERSIRSAEGRGVDADANAGAGTSMVVETGAGAGREQRPVTGHEAKQRKDDVERMIAETKAALGNAVRDKDNVKRLLGLLSKASPPEPDQNPSIVDSNLSNT